MVRFDVMEVDFDPSVGVEIQKLRPALIVSPDEMNRSLDTVIVAPMTTHGFAAGTRVPCHFKGQHGFVVLDQMRSISRQRVRRFLGKINPATGESVLAVLREMFAV